MRLGEITKLRNLGPPRPAAEDPDDPSRRDSAMRLYHARLRLAEARSSACQASLTVYDARVTGNRDLLGECVAAVTAARSKVDACEREERAASEAVFPCLAVAVVTPQRRVVLACDVNRSASDSTGVKKGIDGPGTFPTFLFDPTPGARVAAALLPCPLPPDTPDAVVPLLLDADTAKLNMLATAETAATSGAMPAHTVQHVVGKVLEKYRALGEVFVNTTMAQCGVKSVIASSDSRPDVMGGFTVDGAPGNGFVPCRIREFKGSSSSCQVALPQAFTEAANVCAHLVQLGVRAEQAIVPVDVVAGGMIQFAACFMADGTLPLPLVLSEPLNIGSLRGARVAERYLLKAKSHMESLMQLLLLITTPPAPVPAERFLLIPDSVFVKPGCINIDTFGPVKVKEPDPYKAEKLRAWIVNMHHIFGCLYESEARVNVCFPLGFCLRVLLPPYHPESCTGMFFPDLTKSSNLNPLGKYTMQAPIGRSLLFKFTAALRTFVAAIHSVNVVHGDLYPSNIFWRLAGDGDVHIRVIDWDTAFFLRHEKGDVPSQLAELWRHSYKWSAQYQRSHDARDLDNFMVGVLEYVLTEYDRAALQEQLPEAVRLWEDVARAQDPSASNAVFKRLQGLYVSTGGAVSFARLSIA